ncbi:MAG: hypothetical protein PHT17_07685 [Proteiniphilum sp.]|nr:hypothetical protein [Proteiniphilum sp.]
MTAIISFYVVQASKVRANVKKIQTLNDVNVDLAAPSYVNRQSLSVNGKYESITRKDLETVAKNNDILEYNVLIDRVVSALSEFEQHAKRLDINKILIQQIANELINV